MHDVNSLLQGFFFSPILTPRTLLQIPRGLLFELCKSAHGTPSLRDTFADSQGGSFPFFPTRPAGLLPFSGTLFQIPEGDLFPFFLATNRGSFSRAAFSSAGDLFPFYLATNRGIFFHFFWRFHNEEGVFFHFYLYSNQQLLLRGTQLVDLTRLPHSPLPHSPPTLASPVQLVLQTPAHHSPKNHSRHTARISRSHFIGFLGEMLRTVIG